MFAAFLNEFGPWSWWILGLILLAAELAVPGVFLVWIGLAAIAVGAISLAVWNMAAWQWEVQMLVFAALSVAFVIAGRRFYAGRDHASDQPLLNQRAESYVGRIATLGEPVVDGRGRLRIDDGFWPVRGPDLPAGTRVRITGAEGNTLTVEKA
jgi:membrane protein implicated in regulation of membrane protease activity